MKSPLARHESAQPLLFAEQIRPGQRWDLGGFTLSSEQIHSFAEDWDPLPLHLSAEHAGGTAFGGVIASGIQSLAVFQRLAVGSVYSTWDIFAGRRLLDVQFLGPVRAAEPLRGGMEVLTVAMTYPERALVSCAGWLMDDVGHRLLELTAESYVRRSPSLGE